MNSPISSYFKLEDGSTFSGASAVQLEQIIASMQRDYCLTAGQICEAAGVSTAMVLRVALGLSAAGAVLTALVGDSRAGYVTLAALRQLANAGSLVTVFTLDTASETSVFGQHLLAAHAAGITLLSLEDTPVEECLSCIEQAHALIFGTYGDPLSDSETCQNICKGVNELQTPVHTLELPPGIDPTTGSPTVAPVFAATTIATGLPLAALAVAAEFAGRMYLCDISVPQAIYSEFGDGLKSVFIRQPVNQIFIATNSGSE